MMITSEPGPRDERALRTLLAAAVNAEPHLQPPPSLGSVGSRAIRLGRVRRAQRAAGALAAVVIAAVGVAVLPHGSDGGPSTVSVGTTMVTRSNSMEPAVHAGDVLVIDTSVRTVQQLRRGDIIVFTDPGDWLPSPSAGESVPWLVKRVIGLPGDTVTCCGLDGRLVVNGTALAEPYVAPGDRPSDQIFTVTVHQGELWVMGDHRSVSADSRSHRDRDDGQVSITQVVGRVVTVRPPGSPPPA